jgi:hypothetical protein
MFFLSDLNASTATSDSGVGHYLSSNVPVVKLERKMFCSSCFPREKDNIYYLLIRTILICSLQAMKS